MILKINLLSTDLKITEIVEIKTCNTTTANLVRQILRIYSYIGSEMRMKNSAGEDCVLKFLRSREGFHRVCSIRAADWLRRSPI